MKQLISLIVLVFSSAICLAQVLQKVSNPGKVNNYLVNKEMKNFNNSHNLKIDSDWLWNTFMGSSSADRGKCAAVDGNGNVYITGYGQGTWGLPVDAPAGWIDAFVAKLDSSGILVWNTFLGGTTYDDYGKSIAIDNAGNIYITGESDASWGTPINDYAGGGFDVFAAKLDNDGVLQWNTFLGSTLTDYGEGIEVDGDGNIYIVGWSDENWGSPVNGFSGDRDGFAAMLNNNGELIWNTFVGSSRSDETNSIKVSGNGIYIAGMSRATWGSPINPYTGGRDGFVAKLTGSGNLEWVTFLGSSYTDESNGIAVDGNSNIYVVGTSYEDSWGSAINDNSGWDEAFVVKLNSDGTLIWNTFLGSSNNDEGRSIAVDNSGNVYVTGISKATWNSPVNAFVGDNLEEAYAAKLNSSGKLQWNTFMGASSWDYGNSIAVDKNGIVYVAGTTYAENWGSPVNDHAGWSYDAFVVKFDYSNVVGFDDNNVLPKEFKLSQNYPNPFNPSTIIRYSIPEEVKSEKSEVKNVSLVVYDILGREVATLVNKEQPQGNYEVKFNGNELTSGIYFFRLKVYPASSGTDKFTETRKMILLR